MSNAGNLSSIPDKINALTSSLKEDFNEEIRRQLIVLINELINKDFNALVQILYRIDINEKKLKQILEDSPQEDTAPVIAGLIIKRQLEKIESRKNFRNAHDDSSEEEKW